MFIELIDLLRCTRPHEDSWLVATFHEIRERYVVEGLLSCPVCGARYAITTELASFGYARPAPDAIAESDEEGVRVAALLKLIEPGVVLLEGSWAGAAGAVGRFGSAVIALNSASPVEQTRISRVQADGTVP